MNFKITIKRKISKEPQISLKQIFSQANWKIQWGIETKSPKKPHKQYWRHKSHGIKTKFSLKSSKHNKLKWSVKSLLKKHTKQHNIIIILMLIKIFSPLESESVTTSLQSYKSRFWFHISLLNYLRNFGTNIKLSASSEWENNNSDEDQRKTKNSLHTYLIITRGLSCEKKRD